MHISTSERSTIGNLTSVSWKEMTTKGREEVEAAVYKGRTTTRDGKDLTCDESGQDRSNSTQCTRGHRQTQAPSAY